MRLRTKATNRMAAPERLKIRAMGFEKRQGKGDGRVEPYVRFNTESRSTLQGSSFYTLSE